MRLPINGFISIVLTEKEYAILENDEWENYSWINNLEFIEIIIENNKFYVAFPPTQERLLLLQQRVSKILQNKKEAILQSLIEDDNDMQLDFENENEFD
jgi:hypothetical protein